MIDFNKHKNINFGRPMDLDINELVSKLQPKDHVFSDEILEKVYSWAKKCAQII